MNPLSALDIAAFAEGTLLSGSPSSTIQRVVTDSRIVQPGDLFIALKGPQFDAHTFLPDVFSRGASAIMVSRAVAGEISLIRVKDTLTGLQTLAKNYRASLRCHVVGITGSNGKTSTKDLTAAVFGSRFSVVKTLGNLNNHIGVPLTILTIDHSHAVAVLEMGMNHAGEIAPLAAMAAANTAIITNIGTAHIEYMQTREAIAEEKSELVQTIPADGFVILNANDPFTAALSKKTNAKVFTAGIGQGDLFATDLETTPSGTKFNVCSRSQKIAAVLPIHGRHMVGNALLAIAAGVTYGIPLQTCISALENIQLTSGRVEVKEIAGIHFIDDTYNANPDSMLAALATLQEMPCIGKRVAVFGAMGELGDHAESGHRQVGSACGGVDLLVTVGKTAELIAEAAEKTGAVQIIRTVDTNQAAAALLSMLQPGDCVLVKGSRSARMEQVIQELILSLQPVETR